MFNDISTCTFESMLLEDLTRFPLAAVSLGFLQLDLRFYACLACFGPGRSITKIAIPHDVTMVHFIETTLHLTQAAHKLAFSPSTKRKSEAS